MAKKYHFMSVKTAPKMGFKITNPAMKQHVSRNYFDVTIIIVNYNGAAYLAYCLRAVYQQIIKPRHVIVVDNASTDQSVLDLTRRFPLVTLIPLSENIGFAAANNLAIQRASTEWIALLNPDAFPEANWLAVLQQAVEAYPNCDSFGCRLMQAYQRNQIDGIGDVYHVSGLAWRQAHQCDVTQHNLQVQSVFSACAAAALYRRSALLAVGGFDEHYFCYFEDVDLGFRLRLVGYECLYLPTAVVYHVGSGITKQYGDFSTYFGHRNMIWTYVKNMPGWLFWYYLPLHILMNIASILVLATRGHFNVAWRAKWDALKQLPRVWQQRQQIQKNRRVSLNAVRAKLTRGFSNLFNRRCKSLH